DRRPHAVPGDVADDQRHPRPGQGDRLIPVAAYFDELVAGQVAVPDLNRGWCGQAGWEQAPLQGERRRPFPVVLAGAVRKRGAAREANSMPISVSYASNGREPRLRVHTM